MNEYNKTEAKLQRDQTGGCHGETEGREGKTGMGLKGTHY